MYTADTLSGAPVAGMESEGGDICGRGSEFTPSHKAMSRCLQASSRAKFSLPTTDAVLPTRLATETLGQTRCYTILEVKGIPDRMQQTLDCCSKIITARNASENSCWT